MSPFSRPRVFRPDFSRFDRGDFLRTAPFQPVVVWAAAGALCAPLSRAVPGLTGAACVGAPRQAVAAAAYFLMVTVVPPLASAAVYLLARRRFDKPPLRFMGDATLALVLAASLAGGAVSAMSLRDRWVGLKPGLKALRSVCWP